MIFSQHSPQFTTTIHLGYSFNITRMCFQIKIDFQFHIATCECEKKIKKLNFILSITIQLNCRFIAVCHPISSPRFRTPLVSKIVSVIAWCVSVILMSPIILYSRKIDRGDGKMSCNIVWPSSSANGNNTLEDAAFEPDGSTFTMYTFTLGYAIPLCLILIFYYLVLRKLRTVGPKTKSKEKKRSHRKVTKLVLTVITVYILCWGPYWVCIIHFIFMLY